ncbi:hypothetical protein B7463_g6030, partial [Scytalidium lignicola]
MSYAAAAAKGPQQSAEEKRAPPMPELEKHESPSSSGLIDVESSPPPSVHTIPSESSSSPSQGPSDFKSRAKEEAQKAREKLEPKEKAAKARAKKAKEIIEANSDNPVVVANAVAVLALGGALGFGAFKKYEAGELSLKVVATWTGVVGVVALGDYFLSRYLFKTKYPPKK